MSEAVAKQIQMVDVVGQYRRYQEELDAAILDVVRSGAYINGPAVKRFERNIEQYLGVKHAIGCASGTDALQLALMALEIGPGDEVITTAFTFVATTETIALLGAKPVYVDIEQATFNLSVDQVERAITPKTKAIIPVHLFGQPCDMSALMQLADRRNIPVIEDTAQALGARWNGKHAGTFGAMATISFYPSKNLGAFGDAGMIVTNDDLLAEKLRSIANHGANKTYFHDRLGVNSRLDSIQAAILDTKLQYLDDWNERRRWAAKRYTEQLNVSTQIICPTIDSHAVPIWHQYSILIDGDRSTVAHLLRENGIPTNVYYPLPLHLQPAYAGYGSREGDFPVAEYSAKHILALPMHSELTEEEIDEISMRVLQAVAQVSPDSK